MIASMSSTRERIGKLDVGIAVVVGVAAMADVYDQVGDPQYGDVSGFAVVPILAITLPLLWRRVAPIGALTATLAGLLAHWAIFGGVVRCGFTIPIIGLLAFAAGARLEGRDRWIALGLAQAIGVAICLTDGPTGAPPSAVIITIPFALGTWALGLVVRSRARMVEQLREPARRSCAAPATRTPASRSPATAPGCRRSWTSCSSGDSASSSCWLSMAATTPRSGSPRSRTRAAARSRTCARWSACCATTTALRSPRSRPSPTSKPCSPAPPARTRG